MFCYKVHGAAKGAEIRSRMNIFESRFAYYGMQRSVNAVLTEQ